MSLTLSSSCITKLLLVLKIAWQGLQPKIKKINPHSSSSPKWNVNLNFSLSYIIELFYIENRFTRPTTKKNQEKKPKFKLGSQMGPELELKFLMR